MSYPKTPICQVPVDTHDHSVVSFVGLQSQLFLRLHVFSTHFLHLWGKHCLWSGGRVYAVGLKFGKKKENNTPKHINKMSFAITNHIWHQQRPEIALQLTQIHRDARHTFIEITKCPPFFRKLWAFKATILVWSGWATSANMTSTMPVESQIHRIKKPKHYVKKCNARGNRFLNRTTKHFINQTIAKPVFYKTKHFDGMHLNEVLLELLTDPT